MFYYILLVIFIIDFSCRIMSLIRVLQGNFSSWFVKGWTPLSENYNLVNIPDQKMIKIKVVLSAGIVLSTIAVSLLMISLPTSALGYTIVLTLIHLVPGRLIKNILNKLHAQ
ncbi:hypothetical protein [Desemzia sp. FAM 23991]|uniref:hypothetical protein n=1 Tax=unclassified Desemzia TaxID=2685243 RepID=UPI00388B2084